MSQETSDTCAAAQRERSPLVTPARLKTIVWLVFVAVAAVLVNKSLFYALVPYGGQTEAIWAQYYDCADKDIDTLIAGSSYGMECIDPEILDAELGWSTYSLATPFQTRAATMRAVQDAYEDHHIKRLILGAGIDKMFNDDNGLEYDLSFAHGEALGGSLTRTLAAYTDVALRRPYFGNSSSLAVAVPWLIWHVDLNRQAIEDNLALRANHTPQEACAEQQLYVTSQGHIPHYGHVNLDGMGEVLTVAPDSEYEFIEGAREQYLELFDYCHAHDIEVIMITTPWPDCSLMRYEREGGYAVAMAEFQKLAEEGGSTLLDFALVRPEAFETTAEDFHDAWHLGGEGARRFSAFLGSTLKKVEAGEDVSDLFYDHTVEGWNEYLDSVKGIAVLKFGYEERDDAIDLFIKTYKAPSTQVEYEICAAEQGQDFRVVRPYAQETTYSYPIEGSGEVTIAVRARQVGSDVDVERSCTHVIAYGPNPPQ